MMIPSFAATMIPGLATTVFSPEPALLVVGAGFVAVTAWMVRGTAQELRRTSVAEPGPRRVTVEASPATPLAA